MSAAKTSQLRARLRTPSERRHDASGTPSLAAGRSSPSLFGPPEQRGRARSADETDDADDDDDTDDTDADDDDDGAVAWEEAVDVHAVRLPREHSGSDDGKSEAPVEDASSTNASPSLRTVGSSALTVLPSLAIAATHMVATLPRSPVATGTRLVRVRERVVKFKRATMPRASRAARASETSRRVRDMCKALVTQREQELKTIGRTRLNADDQLRPRTGASASGKGPSVRAAREYEQARINHIASLKSRNIDTHNVEVSWLLAGRTAEQMYDRLAESALRANAVNSAITKRKYTQGANYQSTRINCKGMGAAAAAQCANAAIAIALSEAWLREAGVRLRNPLGATAVDPCLFARSLSNVMPEENAEDALVAVVSTTQLVFNANPTKLGTGCILEAARQLAQLERDRRAISSRMGTNSAMLRAICNSVGGGFEIDSAWASIVLIVYVSCDPRGRPLLRDQTSLTDLDVQIACALEAYGRGEILRRARLRAQQEAEAAKHASKRMRGGDSVPVVPPPQTPPLSGPDVDADAYVDPTIDPESGLVIEDDTASIVNDDDEGDSDPELAMEAAAAVSRAATGGGGNGEGMLGDDDNAASGDQSVLATKRKRAPKGFASASSSDAYNVISWNVTHASNAPPPWFRALRCKDKSVLETLIAATKTSAREAAQSTLEQQADGSTIANHKVIAEMCAANAVRSAQTLAPFVSRKLADTPEWIAFSTRRAQRLAPGTGNGAWQSGVVVGMARVPSAACSTALHACTRASIKMHPSSDCGIGILWSMAVQELSPSTPESRTVPGVLERHALLGQMRATATPTYKSLYGVTEQRTAAALERYISAEAQRPMPSAAAGVTRSFVSLRTVFEVHAHTLKSARRLKQEGKELFEKCVGDNVNCPGRETATSTAALVAGTRDVAGASSSKRLEPYCTPAPRLAVGLRLNELLRRFMQGRSRKLGPCRVLLGCHTNAEIGRDMPLVSDSEPLPMCTITDFNVRIDSGVLDGRYGEYASAEAQQQQQQCVEPVPGSVSLHVCLNGAVRLPELLAQLPGSDADAVWHKRALLYVGASQASYIGETGAMISAAAANANINSSKKINCADINTMPLLSAFDVYGGGINNVARCFAGTPYSGAYGPVLQTGVTSVGLAGHFHRSDQRGHGTMTLSEEVANELAAKLTHCHHVPVGAKKYATSPVQTRGIPHGFVPGVHSCLDDYVAALDTTLGAVHGNDVTVKGLFSMPFSGVTQALRPAVESTADSTIRHCFRNPAEISCAVGLSYLPDATSEEEAIFTEPLWRRPCQASTGDNPFATSYEAADTVWNVCNTLALIARECGGVDRLHTLITHWHAPPPSSSPETTNEPAAPSVASTQWVADACVLIFGVLYPFRHAIAEEVVPHCYARACVVSAKMSRNASNAAESSGGGGGGGKVLCELLRGRHDEDYKRARTLWSRFCRSNYELCAWKQGLKPMLALLLELNGTHNISRDTVRRLREAVDRLCSRAAWLAYSEDGETPPPLPNPANECPTMHDVRSPTLDPVFCAHGDRLETPPRGCLVGLKPFQLRQIYALLVGAHLPDLEVVQAVRNEGGLLLRESALPTVLEQDGRKRSVKGTSPLQIEADQKAYGSRRSKVYGASLQTEAWDANARLQAPLYCAISPPLARDQRSVGEFGDPSFWRMHIEEHAQNTGSSAHTDELWARRKLERAASSPAAACMASDEIGR